jgi:hypothetical protein
MAVHSSQCAGTTSGQSSFLQLGQNPPATKLNPQPPRLEGDCLGLLETVTESTERVRLGCLPSEWHCTDDVPSVSPLEHKMAICPLKAGGDTPHTPQCRWGSHMVRDFPFELGQAMWWGFLLIVWQVSVLSCSCEASGELGEYPRCLEAGVQLLRRPRRNEPNSPRMGPRNT